MNFTMKLKSFFRKFFLGGALVEKVNSPINGEVFIFEDFFGRWMRIGGVSQSGGLVVEIWKKAVGEILRYKDIKILSVLILGLGCGNVARLVSEKWSGTKIVGIEIDPVVVEVGKKYFDLDRIENLEIVVGDAIQELKIPSFVPLGGTSAGRQNSKFNLILVDLYLGKQFPKEAEGKEFLENIKKQLKKDGILVFNRFYWGEYRKQADDLYNKVKKLFPRVWFKKTYSNLLIFASLS